MSSNDSGASDIRAWNRSLSEMADYNLRRIVEHMALHGDASGLIPEEQ